MSEARMPTTLPSPVDRGQFRFVVDAAGAVWRWIDDEMVWVRQAGGRNPKAGKTMDARSCTDGAAPATTGVNLHQIHRFEVVGFQDVFSAFTIQGLRLSSGSCCLL